TSLERSETAGSTTAEAELLQTTAGKPSSSGVVAIPILPITRNYLPFSSASTIIPTTGQHIWQSRILERTGSLTGKVFISQTRLLQRPVVMLFMRFTRIGQMTGSYLQTASSGIP